MDKNHFYVSNSIHEVIQLKLIQPNKGTKLERRIFSAFILFDNELLYYIPPLVSDFIKRKNHIIPIEVKRIRNQMAFQHPLYA